VSAVRTLSGLVDSGLTNKADRAALERVVAQFSVGLTLDVVDLIDPTDPNDPIARQFVPSAAELATHSNELHDPIGDEAHSPVKGIVHRYPDRVLLKVVEICPVYCRFCFRRELIGPGHGGLDEAALDAALAYVAGDPAIWEVILTGGDPLILSPRRLADIITRIRAIPHVGVIRIHTRIPVVDPARITPAMVAALKGDRPVYVLLHCNHPRELTAKARDACGRLVDAGIPLLGQSVLLRGVNDDAATLTQLFRAMVETRVKPHYLHHGDHARGTGHFRTSIAEGQALMRELRGHVSGLCQPSYMLDIPGGAGKVPIGPSYLEASGDGYVVEDYRGQTHEWPPASPTDSPAEPLPIPHRD
jgi:lysine 2,3-aminomutase